MCERCDSQSPEDKPEGDGALATLDDGPPPGIFARVGIAMVRGYQLYISPLTPPSCRFYPTCSQYTLIAIKRYGLIKGSWLGFKRISRCHPFNPGGIDHVP